MGWCWVPCDRQDETGQSRPPANCANVDRLLRKLGLGKGRLDLELVADEYYLGDYVDGSLTYELKKPEEATELWVEVRATQSITAPREVYRQHLRGGPRREVENRTSTFSLYEKRLQLDGHHLYDTGSHTFRIPLPEVIATPRPEPEAPFHTWTDWGKRRRHAYWRKRSLNLPEALPVSRDTNSRNHVAFHHHQESRPSVRLPRKHKPRKRPAPNHPGQYLPHSPFDRVIHREEVHDKRTMLNTRRKWLGKSYCRSQTSRLSSSEVAQVA